MKQRRVVFIFLLIFLRDNAQPGSDRDTLVALQDNPIEKVEKETYLKVLPPELYQMVVRYVVQDRTPVIFAPAKLPESHTFIFCGNCRSEQDSFGFCGEMRSDNSKIFHQRGGFEKAIKQLSLSNKMQQEEIASSYNVEVEQDESQEQKLFTKNGVLLGELWNSYCQKDDGFSLTTDIAFSSDGQFAATWYSGTFSGSVEGVDYRRYRRNVNFWNLTTGSFIGNAKMESNNLAVNLCSFTSDSKQVAIFYDNGLSCYIKVIDLSALIKQITEQEDALVQNLSATEAALLTKIEQLFQKGTTGTFTPIEIEILQLLKQKLPEAYTKRRATYFQACS